jgi:putative FmdB family regulatory protein
MPVYEYVCDTCGYRFERIQSFHDDPVEVCPHCDGKVRRVISPVGVIFKGSGWYITDNRRQISSKRKSTLSDKPDKADDGDGSAAGGSDGDKKSTSDAGDGNKKTGSEKSEPADKKSKSAAKAAE